ncbi:MAG: S-adenosyl-l-methionine hydroxide adenosyltransferase family protein [Methanosarcinaceae archaeon]|nr:S-adenosyl-l-methionine hydroxide adenosyltransferase family protein [Methanosarcinaceae archaeon]
MPVITLTTDFGSLYPASLKAAILNINETANIIDITHSIPHADIRAGAFTLYSVVDHFPAGTVHVAVVDPSVGTDRRAIAIRAGGQYFVGPDNGLLIPAARKVGDIEVYEIINTKLFYNVSSTFHGRDIFAPVGAYLLKANQKRNNILNRLSNLLSGKRPKEIVLIEDVGKRIDDFVDLDLKKIEVSGGVISGEVIFIDDFGNIVTNIPKDVILDKTDFGAKLLMFGIEIPFLQTYCMVEDGDALALIGSHEFLEISINCGNAAKIFKIKNGDKIDVKLLECAIK